MNRPKTLLTILVATLTTLLDAQESKGSLGDQERCLIKIAALTSDGNLVQLKSALNDGLESGLTINQINDELAQLYAYCGFPRSLNAINTFKNVVEERKISGKN